MKISYRPEIDGLRALAVLAVLLFHTFPSIIKGGFIGVDLFFVISGYLITKIIIHDGPHNFKFTEFYSRRIRRIFPALIVVMFVIFVLGWIELFANEFKNLGAEIAFSSIFLANLLFLNQSGYFDTTSDLKILLHLWSLSIEEQFYLIWPLFVYTHWKLKLKYPVKLSHITVIFGLTSFAINIYFMHAKSAADFYSPLSRFWELFLGSALVSLKPSQNKSFNDIFSVVGFLFIFFSLIFIAPSENFPGYIALLPTIGTFFLLASSSIGIINQILSNKVLVFLGKISYPIYLWHWPLLVFVKIASNGSSEPLLRLATIFVSILLSILTYYLIEKPIRFSKSQNVVRAILLASILLVSAGFLAYYMNGFPFRSTNLLSLSLETARPEDALHSNGSCEKYFGFKEIKNEVCLASSARPRYLIAGDSHAMVLNAAIHARRINIQSLLISGSSCLPFKNYIFRKLSENNSDRNCDVIGDRIIEAASNIPSIKTVVLSTMGPHYFSESKFDGSKMIGWTMTKNNLPVENKEEAFLNGYLELINKLLGLGKNIVFVIDVPEINFIPENCLHRPIEFGQRPGCKVSRQAVDKRQNLYRSIIQKISIRYPEIKVFDTVPLLCDDNQCRWELNGNLLYFDQHHITVNASEFLLNKLYQKYLVDD